MNYLQAFILGLIQGITEFLPISSSGHLELAKVFLDAENLPKENMTFTVVLHFATALSTLVVFRKDILDLFCGFSFQKYNEKTQFILKIIFSMVPAVFVGLFFEDFLECFFSGKIIFVGCMLLITSILLLISSKVKNTNSKKLDFFAAFMMGIAQAVAMLPGISRSGATISTGLLLKLAKKQTAYFSFLMVIPLIFGKIFKDVLSGKITSENFEILPLLLGFITAFLSGLFACRWMLALVKRGKLYYFSIYCAVVGFWVLYEFL